MTRTDTSLPAIEAGELDTQRLTALVFELYSQLHAERVARLALQSALQRVGVLDAAALDALATDSEVREASLRAAERSVAGLLRTLQESGDDRRPLRTGASRGDEPPPHGGE